MLEFDHFAVAAETLAEGVSYVEDALGVKMGDGGEHALMGTHNQLLGLGDLYLEVISINPAAPKPAHVRWFDLDCFSGLPRITNWITRCDDVAGAITASPKGIGVPLNLQRGDLRWQMVVPMDGKLPFGNAFPAMIKWEGAAHPAARLQDVGCRLEHLEIFHPDADALRASLSGIFSDSRVSITHSETVAYLARIQTPHGVRELN